VGAFVLVLVGAGVSVTVGLGETVTVAVSVGGIAVEVLVEVTLGNASVVKTGTIAAWPLKPPQETTKNTNSKSAPKDPAKTTGLFISISSSLFWLSYFPLY